MGLSVGKSFENEIKDSIPKGVFYYRLKDPAQSFGQDSSKTRFSLTNPFDFFMYKNPYLYSIENKSKATSSLSFTLDKTIKGKDIKAQQLISLFENYNDGLVAGLFINFRDVNETYFLHIRDFMEFAKDTDKKSINRDDVKKYDGFLIPQKLKKVKYTYDIDAVTKHCELTYQEYYNKIKGVVDNE